MKKVRSDRRDFLKKTVVTTLALTIIPRNIFGGQGYTVPGDQLTKGIIGVGGMGRNHFEYEGTRLLAFTDMKIFLLGFFLFLFSLTSFPQDQMTTETKVADLLARLPSNDQKLTDRLMSDMLFLGED